MESGRPKLAYEERQSTPDGRTLWIRTSKVPLHDGEGTVFGVLGIYEDITTQRLAADALQRVFDLFVQAERPVADPFAFDPLAIPAVVMKDRPKELIRKLRLALNDSAHHPRYIETVPKCGYRFVAPVRRDEEAAVFPAPAATAEPSAPVVRGRRPAVTAITASAAAIAIVAAISIMFVRDDTRPGEVPEPEIRDFTSLAILPFVDASADAGNDYFGDGLAEELMDSLSRYDGLRVVSRTSAFASQGRDAREIGRLLDADALVEGSVRRDADRLRISIRLVDARNGYQLWTETYDRRAHDIFAVQQDIAVSIANKLTGRLLGEAEAQARAVPATDPAAYDDYLQGRYYWHRRSEEGLREAVRHFEAATRREKSLRLRQERLDEQERQKRADQFNEVKARANLDDAAWSVLPRQQRRIVGAAEAWLAAHPEHAGYDIRFDAVLVAAAAIVVLMAMLLLLNSVAIILRNRYQRRS